MATIFTKIARGEIPSYKVAENDEFYAFLDIAPLHEGHTLVIPKNVECDYIFNLDDSTYSGLCAFAKKVASAIGKAVPCKRVAVAVLGMEVPHAAFVVADVAHGGAESLWPCILKHRGYE